MSYLLPYINRNLKAGERVYCYDRDGALVDERDLDEARGLRWQTLWPKGFGPGAFDLKREVGRRWAVKNAYKIVVRDGPSKILYEGRINDPSFSLGGGDEAVAVSMAGFWVVLGERFINKWWIDNAAIDLLLTPASRMVNDTQNRFVTTREDNYFQWTCGPGDCSRDKDDDHYRRYTTQKGSNIARVRLNYAMRSGEGIRFNVLNVDNSSVLETYYETNSGAVITGSIDHSLTGGTTQSVDFRFFVTIDELFDENDYIRIYDLICYAAMADFASPDWGADQIIRDALSIEASEISSDASQIDDPGLALTHFITRDRWFESLESVILRLAAFGDGSQNTWGGAIWDSFGSSDNKPWFVFSQEPGIDDREYDTSLAELSKFDLADSDDELVNYVIVGFTDSDNRKYGITPDDYATLADTTSISLYGERHGVIDAGNCDETQALEYGRRYLAAHKDLMAKGSFEQRGVIRQKDGVEVPVNRVRAGERVKITDYKGGQTYLLRRTDYGADDRRLIMEPSLPSDSLEVWLTQREIL